MPQDDERMRKRDEGKTPDGGGMRRGEEEGGTSEGGKGSMRRSSHWEKGSMGGECENVCIRREEEGAQTGRRGGNG